MKKKILSVFLALCMICTLLPTMAFANTGLHNFKRVNTYREGQFSDVKNYNWYSENVKTSYEMGLLIGADNGRFGAVDNISIEQLITLASRLHNTFNGNTYEFNKTIPWYDEYVNYAVRNGIIKSNQFTGIGIPATRAEFAEIVSKAFPESALLAINNIDFDDIPDVFGGEEYANAVRLLYSAGIIVGIDETKAFYPNSNIQRNEVAAIATRMADNELRLKLTIEKEDKIHSINIDEKIDINIGATTQIGVYIYPEVGNIELIWTSSDDAIVRVDNKGIVTAISEGTAIVTVTTHNGLSDSCEVRVIDIGNSAIEAEIEAENNRHVERVNEINSIYDARIDAQEDLVSSLMEKYGISYLYSKSYYQTQSDKLKDEISQRERKIAYLRQDTSGANALQIRRLEEENNSARNEVAKMIICLSICEYRDEIKAIERERNMEIAIENRTHNENIEKIEQKKSA